MEFVHLYLSPVITAISEANRLARLQKVNRSKSWLATLSCAACAVGFVQMPACTVLIGLSFTALRLDMADKRIPHHILLDIYAPLHASVSMRQAGRALGLPH